MIRGGEGTVSATGALFVQGDSDASERTGPAARMSRPQGVARGVLGPTP